MSLKDAIAADLLNVFLNTDDWAESCTYTAAGTDACEATTLIAVVRDGQSEDDGDFVYANVERIQVLCTRNPDGPKGGIRTPKIGDTLVRTSIDSRPYAFMGFERSDDPSCWRLIFERELQKIAGKKGLR